MKKFTVISLALTLLLSGCGGGGGKIPDPVPVAKVFGWYESINFITFETTELIPNFPTHAVLDRDNNGTKEILIPPGGELRDINIRSTDPSYIHIEVVDNQLIKLNTDTTFPKIPAGFINSMHIGKFSHGSKGDDLVLVDLGREPEDIPFGQWPGGHVWGLIKNNLNKFDAHTLNERVGKRYWHTSYSAKDINNDGISDFIIGQMSSASLFISSSSGFNIIDMNLRAGTTALIKLADNNYAAIGMPYHNQDVTTLAFIPPPDITVNKLNNQGNIVSQSTIDTMTCGTSKFDYRNGYAHIEVVDVNNDGLEDFIGVTENAIHAFDMHSKYVSIFLQDKNGNFVCSNDSLNFKGWPYTLPGEVENPLALASTMFNNCLFRSMTWGNYGTQGVNGFMFTKGYVNDRKALGTGHFYYGTDGKLHEVDLSDKMHLKHSLTEFGWYDQVIPVKDLNNDGIVDFMLIKSSFSDNRKTTSNPTGKYYKLTTLMSGYQ